MTHTLHRRVDIIKVDGEDFAMLSMAAKKYNDKGAGEKLKKIFQMVADSNPDNLGDDTFGCRYTGCTDEQILEQMGDKAYVCAVFSDRSRLKEALKRIKEADLGMSVVVSGNYEVVFDILKEVGIKPHTVNMSLGIFGKKDLLPREEVLAFSTMCGHGIVPANRVENVIEKVKSGKLTPEEGAKRLASTCTCGIFNPKLAAQMLKRISD